MKTYKEFLEENLRKMGALKRKMKDTMDSKKELRLSKLERDGHWHDTDDDHSQTHQEVEDDYYDAKHDHKKNVKKLQGLAKAVRKDPQGQQHMKDMVKKGKERQDAKRDRLRSDKLAVKKPISKDDIVNSGKRKGKLQKWKQDALIVKKRKFSK